ncbi:MAG: shikimate kinase [Ilumatobacteraceae bacterium]
MAPPRFLVLVGLMGSGKSAVARRLVASSGADLRDTDRMVEERAGKSVREIFADSGEEAFRRLEEQELQRALSGDSDAVIAAAGGIVTREANRRALNDARRAGAAWVVWLRTEPDALVERVARGGHRPLLDADPRAALLRLHEERSPLYAEVADEVVDTTGRSVDEVARDVAERYSVRAGGEGGTNG